MKNTIKKKIIPFADLGELTESIRRRFLKETDRFLKKGNFILTKEVEQFEAKFAKYVGTAHAVGVSSGADALFLALSALGVQAGDEVITQGNAYNASVTAIIRAGAVPRFADIDPETRMIDPRHVEALITPKTKAVLVVHLFGSMGDMRALAAIAQKHSIALIEDAAQSHGASYSGKKAGAWGAIGCFSFYPTKNLGAFGDAGAVTTNDPALFKRLVALRNLGQEGKNNHTLLGYNMRLDALQAIALSLKLPKLDAVNTFRKKAALRYDRLISKSGLPVKTLRVLPEVDSVHHLYVIEILTGKREDVMQGLRSAGIECAIHYPIPVYNQPFYQTLGYPHPECPHTERSTERTLSLPLYYRITQKEQERVIEALSALYR